jgi:enoyl-CoA hydratase/carnithine racemase
VANKRSSASTEGDEAPAPKARTASMAAAFTGAERPCRAAAARFGALPPEAVRQTKALLRAAFPGLKDTLSREGETFIGRLKSPETAEAITAFLEKRSPDFSRFA